MKDELLTRIAREIQELGGRALLVGGCVRDGLLGVSSQDIDCEVHGLEKQTLRELLARYGEIDVTGEPFGIYTLKSAGIDFALPRVETRTGKGHTDFTVTPLPHLPLERAAARRDFTVNAIMRDALTGEIIDPYGGAQDLKDGVLRAVPGGQFEEDPLRVLRGAQFAARFHLSPDEHTLSLMRAMPLEHLSAPRVVSEMKKALLTADRPDIFFRVLKDADALRPWFEEIHTLAGVPQNPNYHPEGDAFEHTMLVLREAAAVRDQADDPLAFMLAALTHDLGKAVTTKKNDKGAWASIGHENKGIPLIERLMARLGLPRQLTAYCTNLCRLHMRVHTCYYGQARVSRTHLLFDECIKPEALALLCICDARGTGKPREDADREEAFIMERLRLYKEAASVPMPTGGMLIQAGIKPGPDMKRMLLDARRKTLQGMTAQQAVESVVHNARKRDHARS